DGEAILSTEVEEDSFRHLCETMHSLLPREVDSLKLNQELGFGLSDDFSYHHEDPDWLNAGLRQLLLRCWREQDNQTTAPGETFLHPAVSRALVLLQESGGEIPSTQLSKQCGVTGPHLSRLFHREVGVPIRRYRSTVRLARFWELFRGPLRLTLMEAALEAGFGSYTQFFRVFREAYGCSPRALLKREESKGLAHPGKEKSAP
ncbi:MAG: helix-turn-helix domain-containing protein, partial [Verrucomicrobiota bacterium]